MPKGASEDPLAQSQERERVEKKRHACRLNAASSSGAATAVTSTYAAPSSLKHRDRPAVSNGGAGVGMEPCLTLGIEGIVSVFHENALC
jgi:hypothetical protein